MKAIWNEQIIAEANKEDLIYIEGNWYFPPTSVKSELLGKSNTPYTCPWKSECQYYSLMVNGQINKDAAFCYPRPLPSAIDRVKKDFSGYIAFWNGVQITE
jgi:uncharacterized protein (DUF427 family)